MAEPSAGPTFPVHVDERELAEDLTHMSDAGQTAVERLIRSLAASGVPVALECPRFDGHLSAGSSGPAGRMSRDGKEWKGTRAILA